VEFFDTILWPIRWVIEAVLAGAHQGLEFLGMEPTSGAAWFLSIATLVLIVRAALIPVFVRQIRSQRRMMEIAPELKKIQDKVQRQEGPVLPGSDVPRNHGLIRKSGDKPVFVLPSPLASDANLLRAFPCTEHRSGRACRRIVHDPGLGRAVWPGSLVRPGTLAGHNGFRVQRCVYAVVLCNLWRLLRRQL
jgi:hypothetical protein